MVSGTCLMVQEQGHGQVVFKLKEHLSPICFYRQVAETRMIARVNHCCESGQLR